MGEKLTACLVAFLSAALLLAVSAPAARAERAHLPAGVALAVPANVIRTAGVRVETKEKREIRKRMESLEKEREKKKKAKEKKEKAKGKDEEEAGEEVKEEVGGKDEKKAGGKDEAGEEKKKAEPEPEKKKTKKQCKNDCLKNYENCVEGREKSAGTSCLRFRKECLYECKILRM